MLFGLGKKKHSRDDELLWRNCLAISNECLRILLVEIQFLTPTPYLVVAVT